MDDGGDRVHRKHKDKPFYLHLCSTLSTARTGNGTDLVSKGWLLVKVFSTSPSANPRGLFSARRAGLTENEAEHPDGRRHRRHPRQTR